jgi:nitroreductase
MDVFEAILTRRSIRQYTDAPVADEIVQKMLRAAMYAPSAVNTQPWEFVVITDRAILDEIPNRHPFARMAAQAPLAILVCGDIEREMGRGYWVQDCSAATQNLLLAAHGLGLGAVWCGIHPRQDRIAAFREFFNLPEHIAPLGLIVIGYPAEQRQTDERFQPDKVHYNRW